MSTLILLILLTIVAKLYSVCLRIKQIVCKLSERFLITSLIHCFDTGQYA